MKLSFKKRKTKSYKKPTIRKSSMKKPTIRKPTIRKPTMKKPTNRKIQYGGVRLYEDNPLINELSPADFNDSNQLTANNGQSGLIMFYADWCPHCNNPDTIRYWNETAKRMKSNNIWIGAMNCGDNENNKIATSLKINGFPTIALIDREGNIISQENIN